jgi:hypothetical protein
MSCSNSCPAELVMLSTAASDVVTSKTRVFRAHPRYPEADQSILCGGQRQV